MAADCIANGSLQDALDRRLRLQTESQSPEAAPVLRAYLTDELAPNLEHLGFQHRIVENPVNSATPFLLATRHEGDHLPTVLLYGHGDVTQGNPESWREGLDCEYACNFDPLSG